MSAQAITEVPVSMLPLDQYQMEALPQLPEPFASQALALESQIIGLLMLTGGADAGAVDPSDFGRHENLIIFNAIVHLAMKGESPDVTDVAEYLDDQGLLAAVGGLQALAIAAVDAPSMTVRSLARLFKGYAMMRFEMQVMSGDKYLAPLADAISRGLAHGVSWVVDSVEVNLDRYLGDVVQLRSVEQVRVCNVWTAP